MSVVPIKDKLKSGNQTSKKDKYVKNIGNCTQPDQPMSCNLRAATDALGTTNPTVKITTKGVMALSNV